MNFEQLWNYIKNKKVTVYAKFKNNIEVGPMLLDNPKLVTNMIKNSKYIRYDNVKAEITISMLEPSNKFLAIDETDIIEIIKEENYVLVKCKIAEYKISFR